MKQMKKYTAFLLLAAIIFSLTACSEPEKKAAPSAKQAPLSTLACDFPLHSGVTFGMTRDEVIKKEEAAGFQMIKDMTTPDKAAVSLGTTIDHFYDEAYLPDLFSTGTFAGIPNSDVAYWFNEQGQLFRMQYSLNCWDDTEQSRQNIQNSLVAKYGEPTYSSEKGTNVKSVANGCPVTYSGWHRVGHYRTPAYQNLEATTYFGISNEQDITWVLPDEKGSYITVINYSLFNLSITCSAGGIGMPQAWLITYSRLPKADFEQSLTTPSGSTTMTTLYDDL